MSWIRHHVVVLKFSSKLRSFALIIIILDNNKNELMLTDIYTSRLTHTENKYSNCSDVLKIKIIIIYFMFIY